MLVLTLVAADSQLRITFFNIHIFDRWLRPIVFRLCMIIFRINNPDSSLRYGTSGAELRALDKNRLPQLGHHSGKRPICEVAVFQPHAPLCTAHALAFS